MAMLPTSSPTLPVSNRAGNNQTSPGVGVPLGNIPPYSATPTAGTLPSGNPFIPVAYTSTPTGGAIGTGSAGGTAGGIGVGGTAAAPLATGAGAGSATYDPTSSYSSGISNIDKQLIDILGKGVGGSLGYLLQNMSGTDSAIFQQWLASQQPVQAQEEAAMRGNLGAMGVSGNSSVMGSAEAQLQGLFNAQAAGVNANLMQQNLQNTIGILTGMEPAAAKEVATSGWTDLASVMANITGDIGNLTGGGFNPSGSSAFMTNPFSRSANYNSPAPPSELSQIGVDTSSTGTNWNELTQLGG